MRGFTLLEILVVLCIAGVLSTTLVVAAWPSDAARTGEEARRLAALLELAAAEARASGRAIAWSPERSSYSFSQRRDDGEWAAFPQSSVYRQRSLGAAVIEGQRAVLSPHGFHVPFEATISADGMQIILRSEALGRVSLQRLHAR
jgi:type II secretion system protein H